MRYKISIIIPIFNVENYIKEALKSVIDQTIGLESLEVIMVDDCSTDMSGKIIDEYANNYENFIAIHLPENSGTAGKPRNIGIQNASSDYLMFLDPDDIYTADVCETLYNKIKEENADIVFGKYIVYYNANKMNKVVYKCFSNDVQEIKVNNIEEDPRLLTLSPSIWTKIYKRTFIQDHNLLFPNEIVVAEDLIFIVNCFLKASKIIFLNDYYGYYYRIRNAEGEESLTNDGDKRNLIGAAEGYYETYNILKNNGKGEYFPSIFRGHLEFWANKFIQSKATYAEKKEVLEKISFLFEEFKRYNAIPERKHLIPLFNDISDKRYEEAILFAEILNDNLKDKQKLYYKIQKLQELQKQLKIKKNQVAELQSFKGYFKYKTKNIIMRLKNKTKIHS